MKAKLQLQKAAYEEQIRAALNAHWHASAAGDGEAEHDIYDDDVMRPLRRIPFGAYGVPKATI